MSFLYTTPDGWNVKRHSYSAGQDFSCPQRFYLKRVEGWKEKEKNAALAFGNCIEAAIQSYHEHNTDIVKSFTLSWEAFEESTELKYSETEGNWSDMQRRGIEMLRLYEVKHRGFGIKNPKFQRRLRKEVFPNSEYAGIEDQGYMDMVQFEPVPSITDIKTSGMALVKSSDYLKLDPQLRRYAWLSGIERVGFLWFQKMGLSIKAGDDVSLLAQIGPYQPGELVTVLNFDKETQKVTFCYPKNYEDYLKELEGVDKSDKELAGRIKELETNGGNKDEIKSLKALKKDNKAKEDVIYARYVQEFGGVLDSCNVTKQRVDFAQTAISQEDMREAGELVGDEIREIVECRKTGVYKKKPGLRFPDSHCLTCSMLPICVGDNKKRDEALIQIGAQKEPEDWLSELE